jgi:DHA1 family bicyclomycin/chloramphenicol resistance-like MFS transporter
MSAAQQRTFVLVHGAWHGGWCWRRVADRLAAAGHRVFTPTLTGLGERQHLMSASITLDTHVQDVCNLIRFEELSDVCLVGPSYAGMVISRAVVRDHYSTQEAARALSMLMLVMGVAPILAPLVGGQVLALAGWRGIFALITFAGIALLVAVSRIMVESLPPDKQVALSWGHIFRTYWGLIKHRRFVAFALSGGMGSATMFSYIVVSPRLFIEHFGVSPQSYGFIFGLNALALIVGSQVSARLLKQHRPEKLLPWALRAMMTAGLSALVLTLLGWMTMPLVMLCMMCFMFTQGFVGPNSAAMALSDQGRQLGSASAMMGTMTMSCGALAGLTISLWDTVGPAPLAWIMGGCTTLAFLLGRTARRA